MIIYRVFIDKRLCILDLFAEVSMFAKFLAEFLGTGAIVATVLGAGFMTQSLGADAGLSLLMIAVAVGAVLFVSISIFSPVTGAHFNPIVSLAFLLRKSLEGATASLYMSAQFLGAVSGALLVGLMFETGFALSEVMRITPGAFVGEVVASSGLVLLILLLISFEKQVLIAPSVALWIFAGHIFTSSTSFANPAVTIGRFFSSSPSSINLESAAWFVLAQVIGMFLALVLFQQLVRKQVEK